VLEIGVGTDGGADGFVSFFETGSAAKGEFHCAQCGYGVSVQTRLPTCPMCAGTSWERRGRSPLARATSYRL
jgi:hypothetical protein